MLEGILNGLIDKSNPPIPTSPGTPYGGGYYVGRFKIGTIEYALVVAPKSYERSLMNKTVRTTTANTTSVIDGWANTNAMITASAAEHPAAQYCRSLTIEDYDDWYLPSINEVEMLYRRFKPITAANNVSATGGPSGAMGYNPSSVPIGAAYTASNPAVTTVPLFTPGGAQTFNSTTPGYYYWSSTNPGTSDGTWRQLFSTGTQQLGYKNTIHTVRPVRRIRVTP